jgi:4-amino-4-deoxy-L-arabinose transferase-like glycosyltransferase
MLSSNPAGFFCDEASIGYNAYTILHTGKDEYGKILPIFFQSFGDYRHPIAVYSSLPFVFLFGLTEFAVRLQSVLYGILLITILYLLIKKTVNAPTALYASFIAAITPWIFHYNRIGFEFSCYATFFMTSVFLLVKSSYEKRFIIPFFCLLALTFYTYQPAKLLVPLLLIGGLYIYRKNFSKHFTETRTGILCFFIISLPLIITFVTGQATARFNQVSVFSSHVSAFETVKIIVSNYFTQLSPQFLFFQGENTPITRHFTNGLLPLLPVTFPFFILGIIFVIQNIKKSFYQLLLYLLVIYPVAGAVVASPPFTSRAIIGAPICILFIALGIHFFTLHVKRFIPSYFCTSFILGLLCYNFIVFLTFYISIYPLYSANFWGWQYGSKEVIHYFISQRKSYDELFMAPQFNEPAFFFKFYDPTTLCINCNIGLPKDVFTPLKRQLFAIPPEYLSEHPLLKISVKKTIYYPNKEIAFYIAEIVQ